MKRYRKIILHRLKIIFTVFIIVSSSVSNVFGQSISINSFDDGKIIQRVNHKGTIEVSGTFTDDVFGIEARIILKTSEEPITKWTKIEAKIKNGNWSGKINDIPEGGWYYTEVRAENKDRTITRSKNYFGVGIIIACIGQSNMQYNFDKTRFFEGEISEGWKNSELPVLVYRNDQRYWIDNMNEAASFPGILGFNLSKRLKIPVGIINSAWGGTSVMQWTGYESWQHTPVDAMFQDFKKTLQNAGGDAEIIVWHQGYSDSRKFIGSPAGYEMAMDVLYNRIKELIPRDNLPIICGVEGRKHMMIDVEALDKEYLDAGWDHVRWSQMRWAEKHDYVYHGPNAIDIRIRDGGHFHHRDRLTWASKMTQSVLYVLGEEKYSGGGIFFVKEETSINKNIISLKVKHQDGNKLVLPFPEKSIEGFIIKEKGVKTPLKIIEAKIVQPDKVKVTLQNVPKNRVYLAYLAGECPVYDFDPKTTTTANMEMDSNNPPGNILYDNAQLPPGNMHEKLGLGNMVNGTIGYIELIPDFMKDLVEMAEQKTGFVNHWMVIGSFDTGTKGYLPDVAPPGFDKEYPPEKEIKFSKTYSGMNGDVQWKEAKTTKKGLLDFNEIYSPNKGAITYAYTEIESPDDRKILMTLGSDDGAKVWINGDLIFKKHIKRGAKPDEEFLDVQLKKGKNTVLVKLENFGGGWGIFLRVVDPKKELKITY